MKIGLIVSLIGASILLILGLLIATANNKNLKEYNSKDIPAPIDTSIPSGASGSESPSLESIRYPYAGVYNGTFSKDTLADADCPSSGSNKFIVNTNGGVTFTTISSGVSINGNGTLDASGDFSGSWNYGGQTSTYTGKFLGNTGTGTYTNNFGCSGTFSVSK